MKFKAAQLNQQGMVVNNSCVVLRILALSCVQGSIPKNSDDFLCIRVIIASPKSYPYEYDTIRYDSVYLTRSKKLTGSQLSLPHGINKKI